MVHAVVASLFHSCVGRGYAAVGMLRQGLGWVGVRMWLTHVNAQMYTALLRFAVLVASAVLSSGQGFGVSRVHKGVTEERWGDGVRHDSIMRQEAQAQKELAKMTANQGLGYAAAVELLRTEMETMTKEHKGFVADAHTVQQEMQELKESYAGLEKQLAEIYAALGVKNKKLDGLNAKIHEVKKAIQVREDKEKELQAIVLEGAARINAISTDDALRREPGDSK